MTPREKSEKMFNMTRKNCKNFNANYGTCYNHNHNCTLAECHKMQEIAKKQKFVDRIVGKMESL